MTAAECAAAATLADAAADVNALADAWDASDDERDARLAEVRAHGAARNGRELGCSVSAFADVQRKDLRVQPVQPGWYE